MERSTFLHAAPPHEVRRGAARYRVTHAVDPEIVLGQDVTTGRHARLRLAEVEAVEPDDTAPPNRALSVAERRFASIRPLVHRGIIPRDTLQAVALKAGVTPAAILRWLSDFSHSGHLSSLVPTTADGDPSARANALAHARVATTRAHALLRRSGLDGTATAAAGGSLPVWPIPAEPAKDDGLFETPAVPFDDIQEADFQR